MGSERQGVAAMSPDSKTLLLKDLCGRLPYVTYVRIVEADCLDRSESVTEGCVGGYSNTRMCQDYSMDEIFEFIESGDTVKPYLRPMPDMTGEEICEFIRICDTVLWLGDKRSTCILSLEQMDFLNARHFDYRGLIGKGLALEAPEGMYVI